MSAVRKFHEEYYDGNTVRKLEAVPEYDKRRRQMQEEYNRREQERDKNRRNRVQRARSFDRVSLIFFTIALAVTVLTAISFLQTQAEARSLSKQITSLQKEILDIRDENSAIKDTIPTMELSEVYRIATEELGMVHPKDNQIITYDSKKQDYLKQYDDIPDGVSTDILSEILNK